MKLVNKILLTSTLVLPAFSITTTLTSCSGSTWGYLNPICFGGSEIDENDPYYNFRRETIPIKYRDADGNWIPSYLPTNYIADQANSINYAYSSPATTWYDKSDPDNEIILHPSMIPDQDQWKYEKDGWKSSASRDVETQVSLSHKDEDGNKIVKSYINNRNVNILKYAQVAGQISTTIAGYIAYALQYQASQIQKAKDDPNEENLNVAWGKEAKIGSTINKLNHGKKDEQASKEQNRDFYELIFSTANMHATKTTDAFMRPAGVNFNFDTFPIPSYNLLPDEQRKEDEIDIKDDLSQESLQLLLGKPAQDGFKLHLYDAGKTRDGVSVPAYYSIKESQPTTLEYKDKDGNQQPWEGKVWAYQFTNVPILVHIKDVDYTWVNPTVKDSFIPSDFYVKDKNVVEEAIGDAWKNMASYVSEGDDLKPHTLTFNVNTEATNHIKAEILTGKVNEKDVRDERLVQQLGATEGKYVNGNSFVVLATYNAYCYDDPQFIEDYKKDWEEKHSGDTFPTELTGEFLRRYNVMDIGGITDVFPAYFLSLDTSTYKRKDKVIEKYAQSYIPEEGKEEDLVPGYIVNSQLINKMNTNLLNLLQRKSGDGFIAHAKDVSQESKDLLSFLTYMFGIQNDGSITLDTKNFLTTTKW